MKYDIYLAGPFFSPKQKELMASVKKTLTSAGIVVCDPQDLAPVIVDLPTEMRTPALFRSIFEGNYQAIRSSRIVLAYVGEKDTGTSWELGFAFCQKLLLASPQIYTFDFEGAKPNVMLAQCADGHIGGPVALGKFVKLLQERLIDLYRGSRNHLGHLADSEKAKAGE